MELTNFSQMLKGSSSGIQKASEETIFCRNNNKKCNRDNDKLFCLVSVSVTGEKNSNHQCRDRKSNPDRLRYRPTLYHVAKKAGLYRKAVEGYHIPVITTYIPPPILDSSANLNLSNHSIPGQQGSRATKPIKSGYLRWAPGVTGEKSSYH